MAFIQQEEYRSPSSTTRTSLTLAERLRVLEKKERIAERAEVSKETAKEFKWPFKWKSKFKSAKRKRYDDMMLVFFLNKKNEIEPPKFMPIFDGNMIVYKNKPYEFDPRAVWRVKGMKGTPQAYIIKEIDRRPVRNKHGQRFFKDAAVSNMDLEEIRLREDSTESDEFLIKAALKAQTSQTKKQVNIVVLVVIGLIAAGALIYFLFGSGGA